MVEHVERRTFYQVTVTNGYKQAFSPNQRVNIGTDYNSFFRFYENTLFYPVQNGTTGEVMQVNAVEWLHQVKTGRIQTSHAILAEKAVEVSNHYLMLARELVLEQIRLEEFAGNPPSRQTCLFLCDTPDEARAWAPLLGGGGAVCELTCTGTIHRADSRLMPKISEPLSVTRENGTRILARRYER